MSKKLILIDDVKCANFENILKNSATTLSPNSPHLHQGTPLLTIEQIESLAALLNQSYDLICDKGTELDPTENLYETIESVIGGAHCLTILILAHKAGLTREITLNH